MKEVLTPALGHFDSKVQMGNAVSVLGIFAPAWVSQSSCTYIFLLNTSDLKNEDDLTPLEIFKRNVNSILKVTVTSSIYY